MHTPRAAVRAELRSLLHELSDQLLDAAPAEVLLNAVAHAYYLLHLAEIGEGITRDTLRRLAGELALDPAAVDRASYARQLQNVMDRLT